MAQPQSTERVLSRQMCALFQKGSCETCILTIMVVAQMTSLRIRCVERGANTNNGTDGSPTLSPPGAVPNRRPPAVEPPRIDHPNTTESAFENQLDSLGAPASELAAPQQESGPNINTGRITGKPNGGMPFDPGLEDGEVFYEWGGPPLGEFPYFLEDEMPQPAPLIEPDVEREIRGSMFDLEEEVVQQGVGGGEISPETEGAMVPDRMRKTDSLEDREGASLPAPERVAGIDEKSNEEEAAPWPEPDVEGALEGDAVVGPVKGPDFEERKRGNAESRDPSRSPESADLEEVFDSMELKLQPAPESGADFDGVVGEGSSSLNVLDVADGDAIGFRNEMGEGEAIQPQIPRSDSSDDKNPLWLIPVTAVGSCIILFCVVCLCLVCNSEKNQNSREARKTSSLTTSTTEIEDIPEAPQALPPPSGYRGLPDTNTILRTELLYRAARYGFSGPLPETPPPQRSRPMSV